MSNPLKKARDKLKKGFKELKKSVGDIANKAADKLVFKEIAPFLPLAGMLVPGGLGITSYLAPQLLTALSTGKTRGDINLTGQALTGLGSFLKDPGAEFGPFGSKFVPDPATEIPYDPGFFEGSMEVPKTFADLKNPSLLDAMKEDLRLARQFVQGTGPVTDRAVIDGKILQQNVLDAAGQPITKASLGMFDKANLPRLATQAALFGAGPLEDFYDTASDDLDAAIKEQEEAERRRQQARARLGDFYFGLSDPRGRFRDFDLSGLIGLAAGGRVGMDNGGFLDENYNKLLDDMRDRRFAGPRMRKLATGVLSSSGIMGLLDFLNIFGTGGGLLAEGGRVGAQEGGIMNTAPGMPKGMQVDGRNGTFIPMGVKEKADDVPAMLSKNEFVMTADAVRAAGGGSVNKGAQRMYDLMNSLEAMA